MMLCREKKRDALVVHRVYKNIKDIKIIRYKNIKGITDIKSNIRNIKLCAYKSKIKIL